MPADSPLTVTLHRDRWWSACVAAWALLAVASSLAWAVALYAAGGPAWFFAVPALAVLHAAWLLRRELRVGAAVLRWDGQAWSLERGRAPLAGDVRIALDFDRWLLLELVAAEQPAGWRRLLPRAGAWLAVSAGGLPPGQWHALRCALARSAGVQRRPGAVEIAA